MAEIIRSDFADPDYFLCFFLGRLASFAPYFLRAAFSQATRLRFFLSFLQVFSAFASRCAFVSL